MGAPVALSAARGPALRRAEPAPQVSGGPRVWRKRSGKWSSRSMETDLQKECVCACKMMGLLSWRRERSLCCMYWCIHQEVLVHSTPGEQHSCLVTVCFCELHTRLSSDVHG